MGNVKFNGEKSMTKDKDGWGSKWPSGHTGKEIAERQRQQGFVEWPKEAMNKLLEEMPWPVASVEGWPKNDPENTPLEEVSGVTPEMLGIKPETFNWTAKQTKDDWDAVKDKQAEMKHWLTHTSDVAYSPQSGISWDISGGSDKTILSKIEKHTEALMKHGVSITHVELKSQGSNLVDNETYLYFQCEGCQTILDPHTKSFATLQEHRVNSGWACIWNIDGMGYKVYCAECGEKVK